MEPYEQVYQGDVWLLKLPDDMTVEHDGPIDSIINGKIIIQEGEFSGHHHYVDLLDRPFDVESLGDKFIHEDAVTNFDIDDFFKDVKPPVAQFFSASKLADQLVKDDVLLRSDLVVGLLEVEGGPIKLRHQEHGPICLSPGKYVVGRQIESVSGEERAVAD